MKRKRKREREREERDAPRRLYEVSSEGCQCSFSRKKRSSELRDERVMDGMDFEGKIRRSVPGLLDGVSMQPGVALRPLGGRGGAKVPSDWPP